jgi:Ca-activated chloride channel family protein
LRNSVLRALAVALLWTAHAAYGDSGVIIPSDRQAPDPAELAIESLKIRISIDNGHAIVHFDEVFRNKTGRALEGTYLLTLPGNAAVSNFAVWDDVTRIPGVILERKRAGELYTQIRNESIDPGLLESGEMAESTAPGEAKHSSQFSVKIVPIPAYGYKRIEAEYRQSLQLNQLASELIIPLKPSDPKNAVVSHLSIELELRTPQGRTSFQAPSTNYPLKIGTQAANLLRASYQGTDVSLSDDLSIRYTLENQKKPIVQAYRDARSTDPGFFEASAILQSGSALAKTEQRTVIVLFDTSLSMQWDKLERSFQALESTLRSLNQNDLFNVLVFNSDVAGANPQPVAATTDSVAKALDFVRGSRLRGGTNLQKAFATAFNQARENSYLVLFSDGAATEGDIAASRLSAWFDRSWNALASERRPRIYTFGIGDDTDRRLLLGLARHDGVFEEVGSAEPLEFKLAGFIRKLGLLPLNSVSLKVSPSVGPRLVYRLNGDNFPGANASWVGQYDKPGKAEFVVSATSGNRAKHERIRAALPPNDTDHVYLPAAWARARVDALLEKMDREGEDRANIEEIIRLSRRYHFVTPYTSFLAAPRALLRPRLIRPGDPLLRVRTDTSIRSVIALFPFGLVKPLRYLKDEDIWQTRFVAPEDMPDGTHVVRLILRDQQGRVFHDQKSFVIASQAPVVRVHLDSNKVRAGGKLALRVQASETTRTITVGLYGADPLFLHWNAAEKSNTGLLNVPASLPSGRYSLHVTAEDIAHNVSHQEVPIEVLP